MEVISFASKNNATKGLSIQYSLNGLSFYRHDTNTLASVEICGGEDAALLLSSKIDSGVCLFQRANLLISTDRFVAVPNDIYDSTYDNDYLFVKNIVCEKGETLLHTSSCNISFLTVVDSKLLESVRLTAESSEMVNALQYVLEAGMWSATKSKKGMLFISIFNNVFSYAFFKKNSLIAFDTIAGCDFNNLISVVSLLNQLYDIDKVVSLFDEKELFPLAFKRHSKKVEGTPFAKYFEQQYK